MGIESTTTVEWSCFVVPSPEIAVVCAVETERTTNQSVQLFCSATMMTFTGTAFLLRSAASCLRRGASIKYVVVLCGKTPLYYVCTAGCRQGAAALCVFSQKKYSPINARRVLQVFRPAFSTDSQPFSRALTEQHATHSPVFRVLNVSKRNNKSDLESSKGIF